jgi:ribonuclease-3
VTFVIVDFAQKKYKQTPKYKILASEGLDHNKVFVAGVYVLEELIAKGEGRSKQDAEVEAATKAIDLFEKQPKLYVG